MPTYLLTSHDGYGLGHVRRNTMIATALLRRDPQAQIVLMTGVTNDVPWLHADRMRVVRVPPLVKDDHGRYANGDLAVEEAIRRRSDAFLAAVETFRPDVVLVDRHPFGTAGELRAGLDRAGELGAARVLGLRDVLDEAPAVWAELAGPGWLGAADVFDEILVYGAAHFCDHMAEYGLPRTPTYVGWVTDGGTAALDRLEALHADVDNRLLVIAGGGGGDGEAVRRVGLELLAANREWRGVMVAGPYAKGESLPAGFDASIGHRLTLLPTADGCQGLLDRAGATVQMAGYNTTFEALLAGLRPILMPRTFPRREQAIRTTRLAALGLADAADPSACAAELSWLLARPRRLTARDIVRAGIDLDGAIRTAVVLREMACKRPAHIVGARRR